MTLDEVAAEVAKLLHLPAEDAAVAAATSAAWRFVELAESLAEPGDPPSSTVPDDPVVRQGLIGFARAVYLDAVASRGSSVLLGDQTVDTVFTPEDPYRHWRHYFAGLRTSWGIA